MQGKNAGKLGGGSGRVEVDETYIGGKARDMHKAVKAKKLGGKGGGVAGNVGVQGILERGGHIRIRVIDNSQRQNVAPAIEANVESGSRVYTDQLRSCFGLQGDFAHGVINHAERYVDGQIHTNGLENFRSLLKRGLGGTYVSVEPFHLFRYLDEQAFRYNRRTHADGSKISEEERFNSLCDQIVRRRLTYKQLTGKEAQRQGRGKWRRP